MKGFEKNNLCAVIAAAGKSSRMETPKLFLKFDQKRTFIEKIVDEFLDFGCQQIALVVNQDNYDFSCNLFYKNADKVHVVLNDRLDFERFFSIKLGSITLVNCSFCFIHNCDNPFINQEILTDIYNKKENDFFVQPTYKSHGGHPILISKSIINNIVNSKQNDTNLKEFLSAFQVKRVEIENENILLNINTQAEYQHISNFLNLN